jgi:succinylarginine dihydrolase
MRFHSSLSVDECQRRLAAEIDDDDRFSLRRYVGAKSILGTLDGTNFRLRVRHSFGNRRFAPLLYGRFASRDHETAIEAGFRFPWRAKFALIALVAFAVLADLGGFVVLTALVLLGIAAVAFDWWSLQGDELELIAFLTGTVEAVYDA